MKGWVGLVGWPVEDGLPTLVVTHQLQVERRTGKVHRPETDVLPLCHATNCTTTYYYVLFHWRCMYVWYVLLNSTYSLTYLRLREHCLCGRAFANTAREHGYILQRLRAADNHHTLACTTVSRPAEDCRPGLFGWLIAKRGSVSAVDRIRSPIPALTSPAT